MSQLILGAGFIGTHLAISLAAGGHSVRALSRRPRPANLAPGIEWIEADIGDGAALDAALSGIEVVYHLFSATVPGSAERDPLFDLQASVGLTLKLLERCVAAGVRKLVFVSSGGTVYGRPEQVPIREDAPTHPISIYGTGKLTIENYLRCWKHCHGLDYTALRLANPYGEGQRLDRNQGAINTFASLALRRQPIVIWGDGSVVRDYVHVADVVAVLRLAAEYRGEETTFNIGSGTGTSLRQLIDRLESGLGRRLEVRYEMGRSFDVPANVLDVSRAARELGWTARLSLDEGIQRVLDWMRAH